MQRIVGQGKSERKSLQRSSYAVRSFQNLKDGTTLVNINLINPITRSLLTVFLKTNPVPTNSKSKIIFFILSQCFSVLYDFTVRYSCFRRPRKFCAKPAVFDCVYEKKILYPVLFERSFHTCPR